MWHFVAGFGFGGSKQRQEKQREPEEEAERLACMREIQQVRFEGLRSKG
jgi:hypothetical protein